MQPQFVIFLLGLFMVLAGGFLSAWALWTLARGATALPRLRYTLLRAASMAAPVFIFSVFMLQAAATGSPGLALGADAGGALLLLLLVPGISALSGNRSQESSISGPFLALAGALLVIFTHDLALEREEGAMLMALALLYVGIALRAELREAGAFPATSPIPARKCLWCGIAYLVTALALLFNGGDILQNGALSIAHMLGLKEFIFATTLLAGTLMGGALLPRFFWTERFFGARLAEDAASLAVFCLTFAPGLAAFIAPFPVATGFIQAERWILLAFCLLPLLLGRMKTALPAAGGAVLVALYLGYVIVRQTLTL